MPRTIGYHIVKSAYGLWLPGDTRGHWSEAWDDQIGFIEPHILHEGDPVRLRMAQECAKYPPLRFSRSLMQTIENTISRCAEQSTWSISAQAVVPTHLHLLITYSTRDIESTVKWLSQQMTKAIHACISDLRPVFAKGHWIGFVFEESHWQNLIGYIANHKNKAADDIGGKDRG